METFLESIPVNLAEDTDQQKEDILAQVGEESLVRYVVSTRDSLERDRSELKKIWDECWMLYRGKEVWDDKEEWQSKIALPKSWNSVKTATNSIMQLIQAEDLNFRLDPVNPDDNESITRAETATQLLKFFLNNPDFFKAFEEGIETSFIMSYCVWKGWWGLSDRLRLKNTVAQGPNGPEQQTQLEEITEGHIKIKAIDPYKFWYLKGSTFNNWVGTIEDIDMSRYDLQLLVEKEIITQDKADRIQSFSNTNSLNRSSDNIRFDRFRMDSGQAANKNLGSIQFTEYFGPIFNDDNKIIEKHGYILLANNKELITASKNNLWSRKPPYVAYSAIQVPFRNEGVGLIEMTRSTDRGINKILNHQMDRQMFALIPAFEAIADNYENPEDLEMGLHPGKVIFKKRMAAGQPGLEPVQVGDITAGSLQIQGILDRAHQEGSLISEIQQSLPRFRGAQTLGEIEIKDARQTDFLTALAESVDSFALEPLIELSFDIMMQFVSTSTDRRVASILGIDYYDLLSVTPSDIVEMINGDYLINVSGATDQIEKVEQLQSLIQFMNLVGQNEQWAPHLNQGELLQRIVEAFRPGIRDIDNIIADPETVERQRTALQNAAITPEVIKTIPGVLRAMADMNRDGTADKLLPAIEAAGQQTLAEQQRVEGARQKEAEELRSLELAARKAELRRIIAGKQVQGDKVDSSE